jgi:hypothetical protein
MICFSVGTLPVIATKLYYKSKIGNFINMVSIFIRDILTLIIEVLTNIFLVYSYKKFCKPNNQQNNVQIDVNQRIFTKKLQKRKRLLLMIFSLSTLSIISHSFTATIYSFMANFLISSNRSLYFHLLCFCFFTVNLKQFLNIFIFYKFKANFRKKIKIFVSCSQNNH